MIQSSEPQLHAPSKYFTIIFVLFSIKVFLLVTKHEPEAVEQQAEIKNDGSLSLVASRSFKRRKTQNAESTEVPDIGLTIGTFMIYCF